jgi:hypothetical protein
VLEFNGNDPVTSRFGKQVRKLAVYIIDTIKEIDFDNVEGYLLIA